MDTYAAAGARPAHTTLQSLAALLEGEGLLASTEHIDPHAATPISGADCDSRVAAQNHLFVCKGAAFKPVYLLSAVENTLLCILLGYPAAWILANKNLNRSAVTIILFMLPMWINALMRTLATAELFNMFGITLGKGTLLFGMVYDYLPFMIYPIYNVLDRMDNSYAEAAEDLGATPWRVFWKVTVPLSMPGVRSGILMVFMPTVSTFAISEFLTNNKIKLFGTIIQENINSSMWNYGAALAFIMLIIIGITTVLTGGRDAEAAGGTI